MATLIDAGFLANFANIFLFLFVFAVLYGLLTKIDFFKVGEKNRGLNALIAISVSLILLMSAPAREMVRTMIPWFFVLFLFIVLMLISAMIFGMKEADTAKIVKDQKVYVWLIILGVVIVLFSLGNSFGQELLQQQPGVDSTVTIEQPIGETDLNTATTDYQSNLVRTLFHPKILGVMMLGIIALVASIFITKYE